jgi:hypothetical protein
MRQDEFSKHLHAIREVFPELHSFTFADALTPSSVTKQKKLMDEVYSAMVEEVDDLTMADRSRRAWWRGQRSTSAPWMSSALFGRQPWSQMMTDVYLWNIRLRLLLNPIARPLPNLPTHHCGRVHCMSLTDPKHLYHCFSCSHLQERTIARHDVIVRELSTFLADTIEGALVTREQNVYHATDPRRHQRADLVVIIPDSVEMVVDVKVCNVGCAAYQSVRPEALLDSAEADKIEKYTDSMGLNAEDPNRFIPFIMLTSGNIDKLAGISNLGSDLFITYLRRRLSVALAKSLYEAAADFEDKCAIAPSTLRRERPRG